MTQRVDLKVNERDTTVTPRQLRAAGFITASLYGKNTASVPIQFKAHEFFHSLSKGTREFKMSGYLDVTARLKQMQRDPVSQKPINVEFLLLEGKTPKTSH